MQVPPPRWRDGAPVRGWTFSTINGSSKKGIGILNNPTYVGQVVWNRSMKVRDPDTGKRVTRSRPESEWIYKMMPELRIVSDGLWRRVQARRKAVRETFRRRHRQLCGHPPRYLLSGLLVCGACGAHYIIKSGRYYGCASTINRGNAICSNTRLTRRDVFEDRVLHAVEEVVFSREAVSYLTAQVNMALQRMTRQRTIGGQQKRQEKELSQARAELENIKAAIRHGVVNLHY